jgi:multiple sugar transport system ATP-binding protein
VQDGVIETPFGDVAVTGRIAGAAGHDLVIVGIRPQHFEDASVVDASTRAHGETFTAHVDVTEWLGNELYAYIPYDAPEDVTLQLKELQRELDSEQMRTQLVVVLGAQSKITDGTVTDLWFDNEQIHVFDPATGENLTQYVAQPELVKASSPAGDRATGPDPRATAQHTEDQS